MTTRHEQVVALGDLLDRLDIGGLTSLEFDSAGGLLTTDNIPLEENPTWAEATGMERTKALFDKAHELYLEGAMSAKTAEAATTIARFVRRFAERTAHKAMTVAEDEEWTELNALLEDMAETLDADVDAEWRAGRFRVLHRIILGDAVSWCRMVIVDPTAKAERDLLMREFERRDDAVNDYYGSCIRRFGSEDAFPDDEWQGVLEQMTLPEVNYFNQLMAERNAQAVLIDEYDAFHGRDLGEEEWNRS